MRQARLLGRLTATLLAATVLAAGGALDADPAKPEYLRYAEFTAQDTPAQVALKQAYNDAVVRYNEALYDYHVTLGKHDQLVDIYNGSTNPAERQNARDEAALLRAKLTTLRREVLNRAAVVDEAARRAATAGIPLK